MKKHYLKLLVLLLISMSTYGQNIKFTDAKFKKALVDHKDPIVDTNKDGEISIAEAKKVTILNLYDKGITSLKEIHFFTNLRNLSCSRNKLSVLDISKNLKLSYLSCGSNQLSILDVSKNLALSDLECSSNQLSILDVSKNEKLTRLDCSDNQLSILGVSKNLALSDLNCGNNPLGSLDVSKNLALTSLHCYGNQLSILDVSKNLALTYLKCYGNQLSILDVSKHLALSYLDCRGNQLKSLDVRNCKLEEINFSNNPLITTAYLINQPFEVDDVIMEEVHFKGCPKLNFICVDKNQVDRFKKLCDEYKYTNCNVNSTCNENFFKIQGKVRYSGTNKNCKPNDPPFPNLKINISTGRVGDGAIVYANGKGKYYHLVNKEGNYIVYPDLTSFKGAFEIDSVNPARNIVKFPGENPAIRDFCIKRAKKDVNDLAIVMLPTKAKPGFKATYQIIYRNKGNTVQSGTIKLTYDDTKQKFVSTTGNLKTAPSNGEIVFNFNNLQLFETKTFTVSFNLNKPTDNPSLNDGDQLCYKAEIQNANHTDVTPLDNIFVMCQDIRNSWDPNDKTCLEGKTILPSYVGKYLHYMIRFENKGSAEATNIVVKDEIDTTKFDVKTIEPVQGSHPFITKISNKNKVEFIFNNINLPFEDAKNDGYVIFKVKTLSSLKLGDVIKNKAGIYFDFNKPIITNEAITTVKEKEKEEVKFTDYFKLYPNPTTHILNIEPIRNDIKVEFIYIYNNYGNLVTFFYGTVKQLNLDFLDPEYYHVKLQTNKGMLSAPFVIKR